MESWSRGGREEPPNSPHQQGFWRIDHRQEWVLSRRTESGETIERVIGHCTFAGLAFRHSLATFHVCYRFAWRMGTARGQLWPSTRAELRCFKGLPPLLVSDWVVAWSRRVTCSDASHWGYGAVESTWEVQAVKAAGMPVEPRVCRHCRRAVAYTPPPT